MLDIKFILNNQELVKQQSKNKGYTVDVDRLVEVTKMVNDLKLKIDDLRAQRNNLSAKLKDKPEEQIVNKVKQLKNDLNKLEADYKQFVAEQQQLLYEIPNIPLETVPVGSSEAENKVIRTLNSQPEFSFDAKTHDELGHQLNLIDKQRASKIAGSRFVYLKNDLVLMQFAIVDLVMKTLTNQDVLARIIHDNGLNIPAKPFSLIIPPALLRTAPYKASGRLDAKEVTYKIDQDDLWLNASAEHTLCTMYMDEILDYKELPIRMLGYSTSFRREAGTYGKDMEGIIRLHQFDKLEMEILANPATAFEESKLTICLEEYLLNSLGLNYQVIEKCSADIGKPNAFGLDINCWFPGQKRYIETHTSDYMTDYQSRDLKIRFKNSSNKLELVHTIDATAFAISRILAAIMENYQQADGSIRIPDVLQQYMNKEIIK